jgi:hypothetical protein
VTCCPLSTVTKPWTINRCDRLVSNLQRHAEHIKFQVLREISHRREKGHVLEQHNKQSRQAQCVNNSVSRQGAAGGRHVSVYNNTFLSPSQTVQLIFLINRSWLSQSQLSCHVMSPCVNVGCPISDAVICCQLPAVARGGCPCIICQSAFVSVRRSAYISSIRWFVQGVRATPVWTDGQTDRQTTRRIVEPLPKCLG